MTLTAEEIKEAILQVDLKPGVSTVVLFDRKVIDPRDLYRAMEQLRDVIPDVEPGGIFVPVTVAPGKTIADAVHFATEEQKREWAELLKGFEQDA